MNFRPKEPLLSQLIEIRRAIHQNPELGFQEEETSELIATFLSSCEGIEVHRGVGKTGVVGVLNSETSQEGVALRADIDALPILEATGLSYASRNSGVMHACGHDGHTAALLGAAKMLSERRADIAGRIIFIFQPAEEQLGGAKVLCEEGILERFGVKAVFGLHGWPGVELGQICVAERTVMAASDRIEIEITGRGSHASTPHLGADPIHAGADIVKALMSIPVRRHDPREPSVVSVGVFQAGSKGNIIPEKAHITGTIRTLTPESRGLLHKLVHETTELCARVHGCEVKVDTSKGYPAVINRREERDLVVEVARSVLGADRLLYPYPASLAGEDFSFYLERVPGAFFFIGLGDSPALHNDRFDFDDRILPAAVQMHCELAKAWTLRRAAHNLP